MGLAGPESITPLSSPRLDGQKGYIHAKQHRATSTKRLSGSPALNASTSSLQSNTSAGSFGAPTGLDSRTFEDERFKEHKYYLRHHHHQSSYILSQVADWLQHEKAKKTKRKPREEGMHSKIVGAIGDLKTALKKGHGDAVIDHRHGLQRTASNSSDRSIDLDSLEKILAGIGLGDDKPNDNKTSSHFYRRSSTKHKLLRKHSVSSDTENVDGDVVVPSTEVVLDNSKTLGYSGGTAESQISLLNPNRRALKEKEAWLRFKSEIVRLAHTLRLKGWRQVPLDRGGDIDVERLSGALTNAVYVVSPPANLSQKPATRNDGATSGKVSPPPP